MAEDRSNINWFPGHMRKALNQTAENLKLVDIVFETVDARIPFSSRNPELNDIIGNKPHIILLNKADLADPVKTNEWVNHYRKQGIKAIPIQANRKGGIDNLKKSAEEELKDLLEKAAAKGRLNKYYVEGVDREYVSDCVSIFTQAGLKLSAVYSDGSNLITLCEATSAKRFNTFVLLVADAMTLTTILWVNGSFNYGNTVRCFFEQGTPEYAGDVARSVSQLVQFMKSSQSGAELQG
ncbi:MAG: hypothetical protein IKH76_08130, partial [Clostridiales bacterium]|nr:hypothetical protein [Clostridiales bacterium]